MCKLRVVFPSRFYLSRIGNTELSFQPSDSTSQGFIKLYGIGGDGPPHPLWWGKWRVKQSQHPDANYITHLFANKHSLVD